MQKIAFALLFLVASCSRVHAQDLLEDLDFGLASVVAEEGDFGTLSPFVEPEVDASVIAEPSVSSPELGPSAAESAESSLQAPSVDDIDVDSEDDLDTADAGTIADGDLEEVLIDNGVGALAPNCLITLVASFVVGTAAIAVF